MRPVKMKLRSSRGASITYALLIFLVCAVVSSIVIVSASTAGGRMSGLKETDQRYYAAVGAARVLKQVFEKTQNDSYGPVEVTYNKDSLGTISVDADKTRYTKTTGAVNAILKAASEAVVAGKLDSTTTTTLTKTFPGPAAAGETSPYSCTVTPALENGLLKFDISAAGGSNINTGTYKLTIAFTPNVKMPDLGNGKTGKATVSWSLNSLSKGRATPTATTNP